MMDRWGGDFNSPHPILFYQMELTESEGVL
jgi:hypothetical protein